MPRPASLRRLALGLAVLALGAPAGAAGPGAAGSGSAGPGAAGPGAPPDGVAPVPAVVRGDAEAPASPAGTTGPVATVLPVDGAVARLFVRPPERWAAGHRGIDLVAEPGAPVRSPVAGEVVFAGPVAGRTVLTVARADGLLASLEPLAGVVPVGTTVAAGDVVGGLADAGWHCAPQACLHWGVRVAGAYVDPLSLLGRPTVVLLE